MAKITGIKPQKNQKRFNVYLDGKFGFGLSAEALAKAGLMVDQELSGQQVEKLVYENEYQKLLDKTLRFVTLRPRSEKEIRNYLKRKIGPNPQINDLAEKVIEKLRDLGILNDEEFALWWLDQRATFRPKGKRVLAMELRQKGIDRTLVEKVLSEEIDEKALVHKVAEKGAKKFAKLPPRKFRQKLSEYLLRRGFSWEVIEEVVDELTKPPF